MKPSISNMWVRLQGISRTISRTILQKYPQDEEAVEKLQKSEVIGPRTASAIVRDGALKDTLPSYVSLAFGKDCMFMIFGPVAHYVRNKGDLSLVNWTPLLPILKPLANCFSSNLQGYERFSRLRKAEVGEFLAVYQKDKSIFQPLFDETQFMGIKLCVYVAVLLGDRNLLESYIREILVPLFEKVVVQTGTQNEVHDTRQIFEGTFGSAMSMFENAVPGEQRNHVKVSFAAGKGSDQFPSASLAHTQHPPKVLEEAKSELSTLIGLAGVKEEVRRLTDFLTIQQERKKHGLKGASQTLHFVFTGNPGTGKTTVARIVGKILYGFGLLKTSKLVETDRSNLVAGYVGQTAIKTDEVIKSALDGVLFIDEAYTLCDKTGQDSFGVEAVNTLLKRMEDYRDRLTVIVAGYPHLMEEFLKMNPGLSSRFSRHIRFEDYSVRDLYDIMMKLCNEGEFAVSSTCKVYISLLLALAYKQRDEENFGNARYVRNLFEEITVRNSQRLVLLGANIDKANLMELQPSDVMVGPLSGTDPKTISLDGMKWRATCPQCHAGHVGVMIHLGREIRCRRCGTNFIFDHFDPLLDGFDGRTPHGDAGTGRA